LEIKTKAETFIGFAIRSGKCKIGAGAIETLRKADLIIVCKTASENSIKNAKKLARRLNAKLIKTTIKPLCEMTYKQNSKIMAICDRSLSNAILENGKQEFEEVGE